MTAADEHKKKLIEVALPLDEINAACKADKDRKTGTIRNLHKWFAPMPLPAWRALLFAALVDDPDDETSRSELLGVIKDLVKNGADLPEAAAVARANAILSAQYPDGLPPVLDPFCGGGSTLVEAQRLGLPVRGSDLNPVPALISRALVEVLPAVKWGRPLHQASDEALLPDSDPYAGLAADAAYYAGIVRKRALDTLALQYPQPDGVRTIAWLWARTVMCPNPACGIESLLASSWWVSKKKGDPVWLKSTVVDGRVVLSVVRGEQETPPSGPKVGRGASFGCQGCGQVIKEDWLIQEGRAGRLGLRMTCVVSESREGRTYRAPTDADLAAAAAPEVGNFPEVAIPDIPRWFSGPRFGFTTQADLYTERQLYMLATFADEVAALPATVVNDGGSQEWATAITTILALAVGKLAQVASTLAIWRYEPTPKAEAALSSHSMPMMWDFPEVNPFGGSVGDWLGQVKTACRALLLLPPQEAPRGEVVKQDARTALLSRPGLVATDPPYFDAIGYADISDYFYLWHRRALRHVFPDLYQTIAASRTGELTAVPQHHGNDKAAAKQYFIAGFTETFLNLRRSAAENMPIIIIYASKEQKAGDEETRWSSILTAMIRADLEITGTWPVRGTTEARMISAGTNAVASYVVMVCRPRPSDAGVCSLADFNRALRRELRVAVGKLQSAGILPVDLAQAAMGPGMEIYSRYGAVLDQSGQPVPVEEALRLINSALGEVLDDQEGELDPVSRFAVAWFEQHGWAAGRFDLADKMARPKGIAVEDLVQADVITLTPGWVQLKGQGQLDRTWQPGKDKHPTAWEAVHHLADRLVSGGGSQEAAALMRGLGVWRDPARALVYRLHDLAAKNGWTKDQERYNALIASWSDLIAIAAELRATDSEGTGTLF